MKMSTVKLQALNEADVMPEPIAQFERWLAEAKATSLAEPTAMALATVGANGRPSLRMVLFKGLHNGGFCFYTNYGSRKGGELTAHPYAALTFWWDILERQVRIEGRVERVPKALSDRYFHSRPRGSQIGAYTSRQSAPLPDRAALDQRLAETERQFAGAEVPLPEWWGGFRVVPETMEFWQGRPNRVHDRLLYRQTDSAWTIERLQP
jgi:pyridoxamine 5'-phosphate oxidase